MMTFNEIADAVDRKDVALLRRASRAEVDQVDDDGRTPLMLAILADDPDAAIVRLLLDRGADPNPADRAQRWTALHFAARDENAELVELLLAAGAAVDPVDIFGNTPLWRAVFEAGDDLRAIGLLLAAGADPRRTNEKGLAPLDMAATMGRNDLIELLQDRR